MSFNWMVEYTFQVKRYLIIKLQKRLLWLQKVYNSTAHFSTEGPKRGITKIALGFAGRNFLTPFRRSLFLKGRETLGMRLGLSKVVELLRIINKTESYFLIHLHSSSL